MKCCDPWLRWTREPLLDNMQYWLIYPHEKSTLFFVACQKHSILAPRLFTFSQRRELVRTITDHLTCIFSHIRVCMMHDPLNVLFSFWRRGKHEEYFLGTVLIAKSLRFFYQFRSNVERKWNGQNWPGKELALSSVNRGVALDSTCMIEAMFQKILVIERLFSEQTELLRIKCWKEGKLLFWRHNRFYKSQSGLKELGQAYCSYRILSRNDKPLHYIWRKVHN